jgi:glucokinase
MILVGDVGGTHVRVGFAHITGGRVRIERQRVYQSKVFAGLKEILGSFLQGCAERIDAVCLGVPGPMEGMRCATTNLPWIIDGEELLQSLPIPSVHLLNGLEATAYGILTLDPSDLIFLNPVGKHRAGNKEAIAAGTGLGEAGLYWDGSTHHPFATEGGHSDFAPRTHRE